jgi:hypothetical protein
VPRAYSTNSNVTPEPFHEWPDCDPKAAATHAQEYEDQRLRLQATLANQGQEDELFVAKVFAMQRPDGGAHTYTTWTEGVRTPLPPADVILLVEQPETADDEPLMTWVRWDVAAQVCADGCWKVMSEFKPPRLLTVAWPAADALEVLKARKLR